MPSSPLFIEAFNQEGLLPPIYIESPISRILTTISSEQIERTVNLPSAAPTTDMNPLQIMQFF